MLPNFGDNALEAARFALAAVDRTPATADVLDVLAHLIEYAEWINIELAQAETRLTAQQPAPETT